MTFKPPTKTDIYGYAFLIFVFAIGIYTSYTNMNFFENVFVREDGRIEYATAFMLLFISLLQLYRFFKLSKYKGYLWQIVMIGFVIICFLGAKNEISWGQRISSNESAEYFIENNAQHEINLHNMGVDGNKVNKPIFSQLLTVILVIYLIIIPVLYQNFGQLKNLMAKFAVPLPHWHHSLAFVIASIIMFIIPSSKKWELYELAFGVIFFLIFLNPYNARIYSKTE